SFADDAAVEVVVAVCEVALNGLVHGCAPVRVRAWQHGGTLIVEADDVDGRPLPATAGYFSQDSKPATGSGLWHARRFAAARGGCSWSGAGWPSGTVHFGGSSRQIRQRQVSPFGWWSVRATTEQPSGPGQGARCCWRARSPMRRYLQPRPPQRQRRTETSPR